MARYLINMNYFIFLVLFFILMYAFYSKVDTLGIAYAVWRGGGLMLLLWIFLCDKKRQIQRITFTHS